MALFGAELAIPIVAVAGSGAKMLFNYAKNKLENPSFSEGILGAATGAMTGGRCSFDTFKNPFTWLAGGGSLLCLVPTLRFVGYAVLILIAIPLCLAIIDFILNVVLKHLVFWPARGVGWLTAQTFEIHVRITFEKPGFKINQVEDLLDIDKEKHTLVVLVLRQSFWKWHFTRKATVTGKDLQITNNSITIRKLMYITELGCPLKDISVGFLDKPTSAIGCDPRKCCDMIEANVKKLVWDFYPRQSLKLLSWFEVKQDSIFKAKSWSEAGNEKKIREPPHRACRESFAT